MLKSSLPEAAEDFHLVGRERSGFIASQQFLGWYKVLAAVSGEAARHLQKAKTLNSSPWCSSFHRLQSKTLDWTRFFGHKLVSKV